MMRVLIADDHDLLRDVFAAWLAKEQIACSTAPDLTKALAIVRSSEPFDLVLLDYRMPGMEGLDGLTHMLAQARGAHVALMSGNLPADLVHQALTMGAVGFLPKTLPMKAFVEAARMMAQGAPFLPPELAPAAPPPPGAALTHSLTAREAQILRRLVQGLTDAQIAADLSIAEPTLRLNLRTLFRKIGVETHDEARQAGRDAGLI
ncbi:response regulator [Paracoccus sp. NSM]|uniref:response regulator n=1 Tax=Paracoccus sp. NSM TaxID=3457784 RepID=UPI004035C84D